eukprot:COSAG05_NODE_21742_length_269_cov_1.500000_1_plen_89_part_11
MLSGLIYVAAWVVPALYVGMLMMSEVDEGLLSCFNMYGPWQFKFDLAIFAIMGMSAGAMLLRSHTWGEHCDSLEMNALSNAQEGSLEIG